MRTCLTMSLCLPLLACGADKGAPGTTAASDAAEAVSISDEAWSELVATEDVVIDEPSFVLNLRSGEELSFFVHDDGSVGVSGRNRDGGSVLDDPLLQDATPAELFHAVSREPMPPGLAVHHDRLLADGRVLPLEEALAGVPAGWRNQVHLNSSSPCYNSTFVTNHGDHPSYDRTVIRLNSSGNLYWTTGSVDRYKAGFCLQEGQGHSELTYLWGESGPHSELGGQCAYYRTRSVVWGRASPTTLQTYSATTYRTYVWWRPSGASRRVFRHIAGNASGDVYDWAQRYRESGPCN